METVNSVAPKKIMDDTRNNWVTMMFKTKCKFACFRKQSHIDSCIEGFRDLERFGFVFDEFGFADNHVHFPVNVPKRYSIQTAEIMLKSHSAKKFSNAILDSESDIPMVVSGVVMNIMNQLG